MSDVRSVSLHGDSIRHRPKGVNEEMVGNEESSIDTDNAHKNAIENDIIGSELKNGLLYKGSKWAVK